MNTLKVLIPAAVIELWIVGDSHYSMDSAALALLQYYSLSCKLHFPQRLTTH